MNLQSEKDDSKIIVYSPRHIDFDENASLTCFSSHYRSL